MKLGYIDYINCYPFYHYMFKHEPLPGVTVVKGIPSFLNGQTASGGLDMGPVSAAAYPAMQDDVAVLPGFCLSSVGYVRSVMLYSNHPIEDLDGKRVGLTGASQTSVVLLKILLEKYFAVKPVYSVIDDTASAEVDASLLIGNQALVRQQHSVPYQYDIGDLWLRRTGYPVVFAVFVVTNTCQEREKSLAGQVVASYRQSLELFEKDREPVIDNARAMYPDILYDLHDYYTVLQFKFNDRLKDALLFFYKEAAGAGLLHPVDRIRYYNE